MDIINEIHVFLLIFLISLSRLFLRNLLITKDCFLASTSGALNVDPIKLELDCDTTCWETL